MDSEGSAGSTETTPGRASHVLSVVLERRTQDPMLAFECVAGVAEARRRVLGQASFRFDRLRSLAPVRSLRWEDRRLATGIRGSGQPRSSIWGWMAEKRPPAASCPLSISNGLSDGAEPNRRLFGIVTLCFHSVRRNRLEPVQMDKLGTGRSGQATGSCELINSKRSRGLVPFSAVSAEMQAAVDSATVELLPRLMRPARSHDSRHGR